MALSPLLALLSSLLLSVLGNSLTSNDSANTFYVAGNIGTDNATCGLSTYTACKTLYYAIQERILKNDTLTQSVSTIIIANATDIDNTVDIGGFDILSETDPQAGSGTQIVLSPETTSIDPTYGPIYMKTDAATQLTKFIIQFPALSTDNIAIFCSNGRLTVSDSIFKFVQSGSNLYSYTAGIYATGGNVTLSGCTVSNMKIRRALFLFAGADHATFQSCAFSGIVYDTDNADDETRALIHAQDASSLSTNSVTVSDTVGGDYLISVQNVMNNTMINSTFLRCSALSNGIHLSSIRNLILFDTLFEQINMTSGSLIFAAGDEDSTTGSSYVSIFNLSTTDIRGSSYAQKHPTVLHIKGIHANMSISTSSLYFADGRQDDEEAFKGFAVSLSDLEQVTFNRTQVAVSSSSRTVSTKSNAKYSFCSWDTSMVDISNVDKFTAVSPTLSNSTFGALSLSDTVAHLDGIEFSNNVPVLSQDEAQLFPSIRHNFICGSGTTLEVTDAIVSGSRSNGNTISLWGLQDSGCVLSGDVSQNSIFFIPHVNDYTLTIGDQVTSIDFSGDLFLPCALSVVFTMTKGKPNKQTVTTKTVTVTNITSESKAYVEVATADIQATQSDVKVTFSLCNGGHASHENYVLKAAEASSSGRVALIIVLVIIGIAVIAAGIVIAIICVRRKTAEPDGYWRL